MENKKNTLVIILVIVIAILCLTIGWLLGSKFADTENEVLDNSKPDTEENNTIKEENEVGSLGTATNEIDACATTFKINANNYIEIFDNQITNKQLNIEQIKEKVIGLKLSTNCGCEVELAALTENGNVYVALNYNIYYEPSVKFTKLNIDKKIVGLDVTRFDVKHSSCFEDKIIIITSDGNKYVLDTDRTHEDSIKLEDYESYKKRVEG